MTVETMNPPGTFSWVELGTTNGSQALAFYTGLFGWETRDTPMGESTYHIFQREGKDVAAMYQLMPDQLQQGVPAHWMSYVAVGDADETASRATSLGGTVVGGPFDVMEHGRMAIIRDPQGAVLSIWQPKEHHGVGKRGEPGSLVWNELCSSDIEGARKFYGALFEWTNSRMTMPEMEYTVFERDGRGVGGGLEMTPSMGPMPPAWIPYFAVSDADGTSALATTLGGEVLAEPADIPGVGRFAVLADPAGACFAILTPNPAPM